jgi:small basic protein (TIGR04137 family)
VCFAEPRAARVSSLGGILGLAALESGVMSQHNSLRSGSALGAKRNVLKRFERVAILKKRGEWKEGNRVTGLRKTRVAS